MKVTLAYYGMELIMAVKIYETGPRHQPSKTFFFFFFVIHAKKKMLEHFQPSKIFVGKARNSPLEFSIIEPHVLDTHGGKEVSLVVTDV